MPERIHHSARCPHSTPHGTSLGNSLLFTNTATSPIHPIQSHPTVFFFSSRHHTQQGNKPTTGHHPIQPLTNKRFQSSSNRPSNLHQSRLHVLVPASPPTHIRPLPSSWLAHQSASSAPVATRRAETWPLPTAPTMILPRAPPSAERRFVYTLRHAAFCATRSPTLSLVPMLTRIVLRCL